VENVRLASKEARGARAGRGNESRAGKKGGRARKTAGGPDAGAQIGRKKQSRDLSHSSPASAYLPPHAWSLLAAVGRAVGVVAGAPLLLGSSRGRRRRGRRLQQRVGRRCRTKSRQWQRRGRPVQAQPLTRSLQVLPRSLPIFPCSVVLISACQSLN